MKDARRRPAHDHPFPAARDPGAVRLGAGSDNHNPTDVLAQIFASGLGLPDRDYYLKPDARFKEAREKYVAHVAKMFQLAGESEARRRPRRTVMKMETQLAEASLDNVALRDPKATDHKMTIAELQKLTPRFDWTASFKVTLAPAASPPVGDPNVNEPRFLQEVDKQLGRSRSPTGRRTSSGTCSTRRRRRSRTRSSRRTAPSTART